MGSVEEDPVRAKARLDFLATMYKAMWDNINRHVTIMWQSVAVLASAFAASFFLKGGILEGRGPAVDVIASLVVVASMWVIAHAYDAALWCNRNLQIISNIERELLEPSDVLRIHPYVGKPNDNTMLGYFRIQVVLAASLVLFAILGHFVSRVWATLSPDNPVDPIRSLPYAVLAAGIAWVRWERKSTRASYARFMAALGEPPRGPNELPRTAIEGVEPPGSRSP